MRDPWGNPYGYLNLGDKNANGHARKDHSLVPINTDFDLYSMGPDGRSSPPLTAKAQPRRHRARQRRRLHRRGRQTIERADASPNGWQSQAAS